MEIVQLFVVIVNITKSLDLGPSRFTVASDSLIKRIKKSLLLDKFLRTKLRVPKKSMNDLSLLSNCPENKSQGALSRSDDEVIGCLNKRITMRK